jgi:NADPH:quinone reductase-like Zn-dependent oxidoreductase
MKAIKTAANNTAILLHDANIPILRPSYILIRTRAIALNPTDYNHIHGLSPPGSTVGCDFAGEVVEIGIEVTKPLKKGDRVFGFVNGASDMVDSGAFGEYIV